MQPLAVERSKVMDASGSNLAVIPHALVDFHAYLTP
jgi:hypothetical protein